MSASMIRFGNSRPRAATASRPLRAPNSISAARANGLVQPFDLVHDRRDTKALRLRTLELRWHLLPLLSAAPSNRVVRIQAVPERDRPLIEERLRLWDRLPPELQ